MSETKNSYENLTYQKKSFYEIFADNEAMIESAYAYAKDYMTYLDAAKTEREAVDASIALAEAQGYRPYRLGDKIAAGDRLYYNNRGKNLFLIKAGTEDINNGIRIIGVVILNDGTSVTVTVGEDDADPIFYINDLLPHLGRAQGEKPLNTAIAGEKLNVLIGSRPLSDAEKDGVKINVLKMLNDKYGITERDLTTAELCVVPALKARDVGFDRSMIAAYGHDDRVCAYPAMTALFECADTAHTDIIILADKEETGSDGATGMQCEVILDLIDCLADSLGGKSSVIRANSKCLSSDVTANFEPNFPEPFEIRNSSIINCGVSVAKYTGSGGKGGTNDATAEYASWVRNVLDNAGIVWQIAELGAVDAGGGGTVAKFLSKHNIDTIDIGVGVTAMHAPYELISKADLYEAHRAFCAFLRA